MLTAIIAKRRPSAGVTLPTILARRFSFSSLISESRCGYALAIHCWIRCGVPPAIGARLRRVQRTIDDRVALGEHHAHVALAVVLSKRQRTGDLGRAALARR